MIDFSGMSDSQLIDYFKKPREATCGRFHIDQLDTALKIPTKQLPWLKYFFRISLPALFLSYKSTAQKITRFTTETFVTPAKKLQQKATLSSPVQLEGRITGTDGQPIPFASVMIKGTSKGTAADSSGKYSLLVQENDKYIAVSAIGFENKLVALTGSKMVDIVLNAASELTPVVVTSDFQTKKGSFYSGAVLIKATSIFAKTKNNEQRNNTVNSIDIFPNPAPRNSGITIRWKKPVSSDQQILIYNASGMLLSNEKMTIKHPTAELRINPGILAGGYYVIHIIDTLTKEKRTASLIIQ